LQCGGAVSADHYGEKNLEKETRKREKMCKKKEAIKNKREKFMLKGWDDPCNKPQTGQVRVSGANSASQ
jgi:hypothetical protein